jgi:hypothetical protein
MGIPFGWVKLSSAYLSNGLSTRQAFSERRHWPGDCRPDWIPGSDFDNSALIDAEKFFVQIIEG